MWLICLALNNSGTLVSAFIVVCALLIVHSPGKVPVLLLRFNLVRRLQSAVDNAVGLGATQTETGIVPALKVSARLTAEARLKSTGLLSVKLPAVSNPGTTPVRVLGA
jgi:hypothetical protein